MKPIAMGGGGEFDRIRSIAAELGDVVGPIGDDTASIPDGDGTLVVSVDASVEDVHFRRGWLSLREVGRRATASALSDLAAAAAKPAGIVVAIVVPSTATEGQALQIMRGVGDVTASVGARILGGDLTSGQQWVISVTVLGHAVRRMSRVGARPGDGIWVTGVLGGARAALDAWTAGTEPDADARVAFAFAAPRISAGWWLAEHGATAMIDLSDGLGGDAGHLAAASGVQIDIDLDRLPLHSAVVAAAGKIGESPALYAAQGGEDYELLVTLPREFEDAATFTAANGLPMTRIGTVQGGAGVHMTLGGVEQVLHGFRHAV